MSKPSDREVPTEKTVDVPEKEAWVKPEITDYKPVTVAQGLSYRIGDGISNLS